MRDRYRGREVAYLSRPCARYGDGWTPSGICCANMVVVTTHLKGSRPRIGLSRSYRLSPALGSP